MPKCEWCGAKDEHEYIYVMANVERTYSDGRVERPARFVVCKDCLELTAGQEWDKLIDRLEQMDKYEG